MTARPAPALDSRAVEIAAAARSALEAHERVCQEREEMRWREAREFRDEMRRACEALKAGLKDLHARIDSIHRWITTVLLGLVTGLLGVVGYLLAKVMEW